MKQLFLIVFVLVGLTLTTAYANPRPCADQLSDASISKSITTQVASNSFLESVLSELKKKTINKTLDIMGAIKGLPAYLKRSTELKKTGRYLEYRDFGAMGLAELGISVRYDQKKFRALNTGRPLIIVANHHLGIADGLALQYLAGGARVESPSLLFLARWIEKLLPHAIFGDEHHWGTAVPIEINKPQASDPQCESKMAAVKAFNSGWSRTSLKVLKSGGALIIFPAGHVASMNDDGQKFPDNVYDSPGSWMESVVSLARLGKADIVFAHVDSVNSKSFYTDRKRFGGGDKERVIWFFGEAIAKRNQSIDVYFSDPMNMDAIYNTLAKNFGYERAALEADPSLTVELMRRFTYKVNELFPQQLDVKDLPQKITEK